MLCLDLRQKNGLLKVYGLSNEILNVAKVKVMRVGSHTFGDPFIQKILQKLAILPHYHYPRMLCLALRPRQTSR